MNEQTVPWSTEHGDGNSIANTVLARSTALDEDEAVNGRQLQSELELELEDSVWIFSAQEKL